MGYQHIPNLYRDQKILSFRRCYALEKVHGTSTHITWAMGALLFASGGERHDKFVKIFNHEALRAAFTKLGHEKVTVYGEGYGGKCQGMSATYGPELRFIAFEVQIGDVFLAVPDMTEVATALGLEVVPWRELSTDLEALDAERDRPSEVAVRRGITEPRPREGIVIRPPFEVVASDGKRVMAKHKADAFSERATPQKVVSPDKLAVLSDAQAVAAEWVTPMRLSHVLDKLPGAGIEQMAQVISAMVEDVCREAKGEIVESREVKSAIGRRCRDLFMMRLRDGLKEGA